MNERLVPDDVTGIYPLLPMQKGMLFHELLSGELRSYFRQAVFRIEGAFDPARCERAWNALAARHDVLRSSFDYQNTSHLLQIVRRTRPIEFHFRDGDAAAVERYLDEDRARGFDLRRDPLTRVAVFRLGEAVWEMVWSHPHILLDGWSGSILLSELASLYAGEELPPTPPYASYLEWLGTRDSALAVDYWRGVLEGCEQTAGLPRSPEHDGRGTAEHAFELTAADTAALAGLARRNDVTLSTVVQCLWGVLLARYNDTDDVVLGNVVSGRPGELAGVEQLVGLFINTIPLRIRIGDGETFTSLVRRMQRANERNAAHDHLSLAAIQELSPLKQALLDHVMAFESYPEADARADGGIVVTGARSIEQSHYAFGLLVFPGPPLRIAFQHDRGVHSAAQMQRLERHFRTLVTAVLDHEHGPLDRLPILDGGESARLEAFSHGVVVPAAPATIVDLWERQVARTPDHVALVFGDERITYREADQRAERIACSLEGDAVALRTRRGALRIVALLGILKAGAACVPISSSFPEERARFVIADSGCGTVIGDDFVPGSSSSARRPREHDLAYVIYTSGSTGRPKGVQIEHGGFVNMIADQIRTFGVTADDRVLQFASCSFDASMSEVFMALLCGATLVIAPDDVLRDDQQFLELVRRERVSVATLPPPYLRALDRAELPLRVLITAGEPPDEYDARHYAARLRYFNAYGPTETSVCATMHEVSPSRPGDIPIGRPVANTRLRILDRRFRPMPIDVPGEIFVAGPGVARGYANDRELTARKFIALDGERWYRTGDRGAWTDDGNVVYRGRGDTQVKLRGFRIELSEIEHAARAVPGVRHAVAALHDGRLALYVAGEASCHDVRAALSLSLPPHMLPAAVMPIDSVPRTTAGKVDRASLPVPSFTAAGSAPRDDVERAVAEAWREVLRVEEVGIEESFFDAGGDSLKAILLAGRLRRAGHPLGVPELLRLQTVAAIAAFLREQPAAPPATETASGRAPLTPVQRWLFEEHDRDEWPRLSHALLLTPARPLEGGALEAALEAVWRHHDALRLRFPDGCEVEDRQSCLSPVSMGQAGQAGQAGLPVLHHATQELTDASLPFLSVVGSSWEAIEQRAQSLGGRFDLERGPLLRAIWCRTPSVEALLLHAHHLVVDAVSWRFILEDLSTAYRQAVAGAAIELPPKTTSYLEWARALDASSRDPRVLAEAAYWRGVDALDSGRQTILSVRRETISVDAPRLAGVSDAEVHALLLLALARVLPVPVRVQLSTHGRAPFAPHLDVSRTAGWFTADFPFLLTHVDAPVDIQLRRLRDELARVTPKGRDYGVLKYLARDPGLAPPPRIAVNYLGRLDNTAPGFFTPSHHLSLDVAGHFERRCDLTVEASLTGSRLSIDVRTPAHDTDTPLALRRELMTVLQIAGARPLTVPA